MKTTRSLHRAFRQPETPGHPASSRQTGTTRQAASSRQPARTRRSTVGTLMVSTAIVALVAVALTASPGSTSRGHAAVGDSGVWVTNAAASAVGRVNTDVAELNAALPMPRGPAELVQSGSRVVVVDRAAGTATRVDPASVRASGSVKLPTHANELTIAGENALIASRGDGRVWSIPLAAFADPDARPALVLDLGRGAIVAATPAGGVLAVAPSTGELLRAEPGTPLAAATRTRVQLTGATDRRQIVASATGWAILEPSQARLLTPSGPVDLSGFVDPSSAGPALQGVADVEPDLTSGRATDPSSNRATDPTSDRATNSVLVATESSLLEVDLDSGSVAVLSTGHGGVPVRPVVTGGCRFAAWGDGSSWRRCEGDPPTGVAAVLGSFAASDRPVFRTNAGHAVLNDPVSGRVWMLRGTSRLIDSWSDVLEGTASASAGASSSVTLPIAGGSMRTFGPAAGAYTDPSQEPAGPPVPPLAASAGLPGPPALPTPPAPQEPPSEQPAARPPVPTSVTAVLQPETGTVALTWSPFGDEGDPVRGYFMQNLGPGGAAAESPCSVLPSGAVRPPRGGAVADASGWTSGSFENITEPGSRYGFLVWGYNGAGCVASELATVMPIPAPPPIEAVDGVMVDVGTDYDYQLNSVVPAAARYEVQRMDAGGNPTGDIVEFSGSAIVPRALTGGPFGEVYAFQIRACNAQSEGAACGPWGDGAAPEPSLTFAPPGLSYSEETGAWSWSSLPENGALPAKVQCGSRSDPSVPTAASATTCRLEKAMPENDVWLRIVVGTHSRLLR